MLANTLFLSKSKLPERGQAVRITQGNHEDQEGTFVHGIEEGQSGQGMAIVRLASNKVVVVPAKSVEVITKERKRKSIELELPRRRRKQVLQRILRQHDQGVEL